ncbi:hypothetical protein BP6252_05498 [Coleophoma cylindrospora]|uniref:Uncharacterized protein n=1 Tax=Coleophoma cylindrospora TaxID=1849047 RepID=A0A3D8RTW0_9HELO|nr:hypothetical protein BP6252_05498 [Coleophoma cylindrospora]
MRQAQPNQNQLSNTIFYLPGPGRYGHRGGLRRLSQPPRIRGGFPQPPGIDTTLAAQPRSLSHLPILLHTFPAFQGHPSSPATLSTKASPSQLAAVTSQIHSTFNDRYDVNDPVTPPNPARQQQHQHRSLRRSSHVEAASVGTSPPRVRFTAGEQNQAQQQRSGPQNDSNDFSSDLGDSSIPLTSSQYYSSPEADRRPHRAVRISRNTASAILYTLEEALRHPKPFTPDPVEENASMSDLIGGGPSASAGNNRSGAGNGRTQAAPGTTGSPSIKGPIDIMRERTAREARRKAEQEALERERAEKEARLLEDERRRSAERRAAAAGVAGGPRASGGDGVQRASGSTAQRVSDISQVATGRPQDPSLQGRGTGGRAVGGGEPAPGRPRGPSQSQGQPRPTRAETSRTGAGQPTPATAQPSTQPAAATAGASTGQGTRSSFPHAFERWETLSAHWEGLTSFWIRRLEENTAEINRDPLSQQLSRQVTDLSAAGANLFHAVVELQRLRASSERKFQRWFFETRADAERAQEVQAMLEATLEEERRGRADAIADAVAVEREKTNSDKLLADMKRELQISKEEARRAWEELGRREQEERERTMSLRDGQPTLVGGVQVVPMMQGVPSRHESAREAPQPRQSPFSAAGGATGGDHTSQGLEEDEAYQQYSRSQRTDPADPFVDTNRPTGVASGAPGSGTRTTAAPSSYPEYTQAPAVQPTSLGAYHQPQQATSSPGDVDPTYGTSEGALSEEEYEIDSQGQFIRDSRGNKIRYQGPGSDNDIDEYDVAAERERELAYLERYGHAPSSGIEYGSGPTTTTSAPSSSGRAAAEQVAPAADYAGQGYGSGWEAVPRHHHPTRLSDVLEEDERSRTSASQLEFSDNSIIGRGALFGVAERADLERRRTAYSGAITVLVRASVWHRSVK